MIKLFFLINTYSKSKKVLLSFPFKDNKNVTGILSNDALLEAFLSEGKGKHTLDMVVGNFRYISNPLEIDTKRYISLKKLINDDQNDINLNLEKKKKFLKLKIFNIILVYHKDYHELTKRIDTIYKALEGFSNSLLLEEYRCMFLSYDIMSIYSLLELKKLIVEDNTKIDKEISPKINELKSDENISLKNNNDSNLKSSDKALLELNEQSKSTNRTSNKLIQNTAANYCINNNTLNNFAELNNYVLVKNLKQFYEDINNWVYICRISVNNIYDFKFPLREKPVYIDNYINKINKERYYIQDNLNCASLSTDNFSLENLMVYLTELYKFINISNICNKNLTQNNIISNKKDYIYHNINNIMYYHSLIIYKKKNLLKSIMLSSQDINPIFFHIFNQSNSLKSLFELSLEYNIDFNHISQIANQIHCWGIGKIVKKLNNYSIFFTNPDLKYINTKTEYLFELEYGLNIYQCIQKFLDKDKISVVYNKYFINNLSPDKYLKMINFLLENKCIIQCKKYILPRFKVKCMTYNFNVLNEEHNLDTSVSDNSNSTKKNNNKINKNFNNFIEFVDKYEEVVKDISIDNRYYSMNQYILNNNNTNNKTINFLNNKNNKNNANNIHNEYKDKSKTNNFKDNNNNNKNVNIINTYKANNSPFTINDLIVLDKSNRDITLNKYSLIEDSNILLDINKMNSSYNFDDDGNFITNKKNINENTSNKIIDIISPTNKQYCVANKSDDNGLENKSSISASGTNLEKSNSNKNTLAINNKTTIKNLNNKSNNESNINNLNTLKSNAPNLVELPNDINKININEEINLEDNTVSKLYSTESLENEIPLTNIYFKQEDNNLNNYINIDDRNDRNETINKSLMIANINSKLNNTVSYKSIKNNIKNNFLNKSMNLNKNCNVLLDNYYTVSNIDNNAIKNLNNKSLQLNKKSNSNSKIKANLVALKEDIAYSKISSKSFMTDVNNNNSCEYFTPEVVLLNKSQIAFRLNSKLKNILNKYKKLSYYFSKFKETINNLIKKKNAIVKDSIINNKKTIYNTLLHNYNNKYSKNIENNSVNNKSHSVIKLKSLNCLSSKYIRNISNISNLIIDNKYNSLNTLISNNQNYVRNSNASRSSSNFDRSNSDKSNNKNNKINIDDKLNYNKSKIFIEDLADILEESEFEVLDNIKNFLSLEYDYEALVYFTGYNDDVLSSIFSKYNYLFNTIIILDK